MNSFQLEFLLFKTVFIKKKKKQKNKAILLDMCYSTWGLLCQQRIITSTGNQLSLLSVCMFLCIFNNRHYILAGFICIHFYILWFDYKVFVGKRIVLHNWVSWKCLFIIGDPRTFVSWKEKKREGFTMMASYWGRDSRSWRVWLF